jgi:TolB protein
MKRSFAVLLLLVTTAGTLARAQTGDVSIDITTGAGKRIPILCESFQTGGDRTAPETSVIADTVLANDLQRSAVFEVTRSWSATPAGEMQAVVGGKWIVNGNTVRLQGEVRDLPARRAIYSKEYKGTLRQRRQIVHQFADDIVQQFTGEPGVSLTRIAFSVQEGRNKELYVMDWDGEGLLQLTRDRSLALSPAWSPEGSLILFTSYRAGGGPQICVISSTGGKPFLVSGRPGNNTSASYAPDGREIALTLSMDGNPEIYLTDARGASPRRLTNNRAIDTSPVWSPTGREIAFTSDRSGGFNVYLMDREGGNVRRLTYEVGSTDSPSWSPKGDRLAFVARTDSGFDVYVSKADGSNARRVVSGGSNENPRWSQDGRHLVFASDRDGSRGLWVTDLDDGPPHKLNTGGRAAMSPAWSPRPSGSSSPASN